MKRRTFLLTAVAATGVTLARAATRLLATEWTDHSPGTLPIVLVAAHDGDQHPPHIPSRQNTRRLDRFSTARDRHTAPLVVEIAEELTHRMGARPHVVINRLSRRVMDPNRAPEQAYEHAEGARAYEAFHEALGRAVGAANVGSGRGLLVDIHGQTEHPADVCLSTHDGITLGMLPALADGDGRWPAVAMGRELVDAGFAVPGLVHELETDWVGRRREATARRILIPPELPLSMRRGGWLIRHYSRPPHGIPSLQVELHRRVRYQPDVRRRFAGAFAASLERFVQRYLRV